MGLETTINSIVFRCPKFHFVYTFHISLGFPPLKKILTIKNRLDHPHKHLLCTNSLGGSRNRYPLGKGQVAFINQASIYQLFI